MRIPVFLIILIWIPFCRSLEGIIQINLIHDKCFHQSIAQIIRCQLTFAQNINKSTGKRPLEVNTTLINDSQLKTVCCGFWDMISCIKSAAIKWSNCKPNVLRHFVKDIEGLSRRSEYKKCHNKYRQGSLSCGFPIWAIITLVVVSVILVALFTCFVHRFCYRRQTEESNNLIQH